MYVNTKQSESGNEYSRSVSPSVLRRCVQHLPANRSSRPMATSGCHIAWRLVVALSCDVTNRHCTKFESANELEKKAACKIPTHLPRHRSIGSYHWRRLAATKLLVSHQPCILGLWYMAWPLSTVLYCTVVQRSNDRYFSATRKGIHLVLYVLPVPVINIILSTIIVNHHSLRDRCYSLLERRQV